MQCSMSRVSASLSALIVLMGLAVSHSLCVDTPADDWKAPRRAAARKNPVPTNAETLAAGKKVYAANCLACHGTTGKGDGPASGALKPKPRDLSDPRVASQTDGELFWKITQGKKPMPTYEKMLSDTQRWEVINYVRGLAKGGKR